MPRFLSSIADKAQSALNQSPLAHHLPSVVRPVNPDSSAQPSANETAAQGGHGGHRSHAFESIQHSIRTFGQQYANTSPAQKIITSAKGCAIDFDSVSNDHKAYSKELYAWGQGDDEDVKDVSDRLAYLNYVHGSLASALALRLDSARTSFKALRDAEANLAPSRSARTNLQSQIAKLENTQQKDGERRLIELREQLDHLNEETAPQEREVMLLKRKALRDSEVAKWEALREYGEKLSLLAQAAPWVVSALPIVPPTPGKPYSGATTTASVRATLQQALDHYQTGHVQLHPLREGADLSRSDTRSFGESHASELSAITTQPTNMPVHVPLTPPGTVPLSFPEAHHPAESPKTQSPPINPAQLNQSPAPVPALRPIADEKSTTYPVPTSSLEPHSPKLAAVQPTVAETGVPITGGANGPKSGSLKDIKAPSPTSGHPDSSIGGTSPLPVLVGSGSAAKFETAEEEKARLAREERERILAIGGSVTPVAHGPPAHESAEEEKKRLEREERERVLAGNNTSQKKDGDDLPPYAEL